jgi:Ca-activated chloride channel family protein
VATRWNLIKVDVELVSVPVAVTDRNGNPVPDLNRSDFHVSEDGAPQEIERLVPVADPFHVVLLLDTSGSTKFKHDEIQAAGLTFVTALRPQDLVMVASFDTDVHVHSGFTGDPIRLSSAISQTKASNRQTLLYDALDTVMEERLSRVPGRKAIVLFSDGVDNESVRVNAAGVLARIERSDLVVYAIQYDTRMDGMSDPFRLPPPRGQVTFSMLYNDAVKFLNRLTGRSGGRLYHAETLAGLNSAFSQIAEELRLQYTLCYYPAKKARAGSYHRIRVTVDRPGVRVRAREGYRTGARAPVK